MDQPDADLKDPVVTASGDVPGICRFPGPASAVQRGGLPGRAWPACCAVGKPLEVPDVAAGGPWGLVFHCAPVLSIGVAARATEHRRGGGLSRRGDCRSVPHVRTCGPERAQSRRERVKEQAAGPSAVSAPPSALPGRGWRGKRLANDGRRGPGEDFAQGVTMTAATMKPASGAGGRHAEGTRLRPGPVRVGSAGHRRLLQPDLRHRRSRQRTRIHRQRALCVRRRARAASGAAGWPATFRQSRRPGSGFASYLRAGCAAAPGIPR
jgi:hypothetical protein